MKFRGRRTFAALRRLDESKCSSFFSASSTAGARRLVDGSEEAIWRRLNSLAKEPYALPLQSPLYRLNTARPAAVPRPRASHIAPESSSSSRRGISRAEECVVTSRRFRKR